jgi:hypothetical protein
MNGDTDLAGKSALATVYAVRVYQVYIHVLENKNCSACIYVDKVYDIFSS